MMGLDDLKEDRGIIEKIDWNMTPQKAFEKYQVKSIDGWKYRDLDEVYYFYIDVWKGEAKVFLMKRGLKSAEDVAEVQVPKDLLHECATKNAGDPPSRGQYPIDDSIRQWLMEQLQV